jgi:hypothetical protein
MGRQITMGMRRAGGVRRRPPHDARRATRDAIHASGVTLTEVVVAAGLLLIAVVPMLKALTIAQLTDRVIERKTYSLMLAQRELERIKARSICHYDDHFAETSRVLDDPFLCTVTDDGHAELRMVAVSVGLDRNEDEILSPDEIDVRLCTYLARRRPRP